MGWSTFKIKQLIRLYGCSVWKSWNGFGVTTNWPNEGWEKGLMRIKKVFEKHLPNNWVSYGPCFAAGGAVVVYAWPKNDKRVQKRLKECGGKFPTFDEFLGEIGGARITVVNTPSMIGEPRNSIK